MINNFEFPHTELSQVFVGKATGEDTTLNVACIGPHYGVVDLAKYEGVAITGGSSATLSYGDVSGDVDTDSVEAYIIGGTFTKDGVDHVTDIARVTSGLTPVVIVGNPSLCSTEASAVLDDFKHNWNLEEYAGFELTMAGTKYQILPNFENVSSFEDVASVLQTYIRADGYEVSNPAWTGAVVEYKNGQFTLEAGIAGVSIVVSQEDGEAKLGDALGWSPEMHPVFSPGVLDTSKASLAADFTATFSELDPTTGAVTTYEDASLKTGTSATAKLNFRFKSSTYTTAVHQIIGTDEAEELLGAPTAENPIGLAVWGAAAAAPNRIIRFVATEEETVEGYKKALKLLERKNVYSIVPATDNAAIQQAVLADCDMISKDDTVKGWRTCWLGVSSPAGEFATDAEFVEALIAARPVSSYRAQCVWADGVNFYGRVPNYFAAAAAAGMRSYEECHRPLSNLGYTFFTVDEDHNLSRANLRDLGANGFWIIGNNDNGVAVNLRQITSAMANNINLDEESMVANADDIAYTLCDIGADKVGNSNISPFLINVISTEITMRMDRKMINQTGNVYAGPQLVSWELVELKQVLDEVYAIVDVEPPIPFNKFRMTVRVL